MGERVAPASPQALLLLYLVVEDHDNLFVLAELAHFSGIGFLLYKLSQEETCSGAPLLAGGAPAQSALGERRSRPAASACTGISLKSQQLTAIFLGIRLYCRRARKAPQPRPARDDATACSPRGRRLALAQGCLREAPG